MVKSMTGYGRGQVAEHGKTYTVEMRSVNHRFLEIFIRLPKQCAQLEDKLRNLVKEKLSRGRVDVFVNIEEDGTSKRKVKVDESLALAYYESLKEVASILNLPLNVTVREIIELPEVVSLIEPEVDLDLVWSPLEKAAQESLHQLLQMRQEEALKLVADILARKDMIMAHVADIEQRAPQVVEEYRAKLQRRIAELAGEVEVDPERLALEVAILADRSNITEEIVRLQSHLEQLQESFNAGVAVGRKLDFLVQEMHREINTIGSKSNDLLISNKVIAIKSEIEKIREQVQNIE